MFLPHSPESPNNFLPRIWESSSNYWPGVFVASSCIHNAPARVLEKVMYHTMTSSPVWLKSLYNFAPLPFVMVMVTSHSIAACAVTRSTAS